MKLLYKIGFLKKLTILNKIALFLILSAILAKIK
jgi:hypothetical protein